LSEKNSLSKSGDPANEVKDSAAPPNKPPDTKGLDFSNPLPLEGVSKKPFPFSEKTEYRLHISKNAYDGILSHSKENTKVELCGVLVGYLGKDQLGAYLIVEDYIRGEGADNRGAQVTFTHLTWDHIHSEMEKKHVGKKIVGWYHTHPGFGIFLSSMDKFIHDYFFNQAFQVALVVDPLKGNEGIFAWVGGSIAPLSRAWIGDSEAILTMGTVTSATGEFESEIPTIQKPEKTKGSMILSNDDSLLPSGNQWSSVFLLLAMFLLGMVVAGLFFRFSIRESFQDAARTEMREALTLLAVSDVAKADYEGIGRIFANLEMAIVSRASGTGSLQPADLIRLQQEITEGKKSLNELASGAFQKSEKIRSYLTNRAGEPLTFNERLLQLQDSLKKVRILVGMNLMENIRRIRKQQEETGDDPRYQAMAREILAQTLEICPELETQCRMEYPQLFQFSAGVASQ